MPFDDLLPFVAVPAIERHDAATCCGERQVTECLPTVAAADETSQPDVGDGWRDLLPYEILLDGDEVNNGLWGWGLSFRLGLAAGTEGRYRRRVTPEAPAPEISAAAVSAMCQRNERDALMQKIATLRSKSDQQQEIILHAGLEVERLGSVCEGYTSEIARLRSEVERLRDLAQRHKEKLEERLGGGE
jgi:hypothetical protein